MAEASRWVETSASPETVWKIWSDPSTWPTWNADIKYVNLDGAFVDGTTGTMETNSGGKHRISLSGVVVNRGFTLTSDLPMPTTKLDFRCAIEAAGAGSRISQGVRVRGLFSFMQGPISSRITPSFEPLLNGLKTHVEGRAAEHPKLRALQAEGLLSNEAIGRLITWPRLENDLGSAMPRTGQRESRPILCQCAEHLCDQPLKVGPLRQRQGGQCGGRVLCANP